MESERVDRKESYGDNSFRGNGIIKCAACEKPLRDHPIGPCSQMTDRITIGNPVGMKLMKTRQETKT